MPHPKSKEYFEVICVYCSRSVSSWDTVLNVYHHQMSAFQVQAFNTSDLSDGILRDPGGGAVLGPIHEPPLHRHSRPEAGQLHAGTCGYQVYLLPIGNVRLKTENSMV